MKPEFCPLCGAAVTVVRHLMNNMFEIMCEADGCGKPAIVFVNDSVKMPS